MIIDDFHAWLSQVQDLPVYIVPYKGVSDDGVVITGELPKRDYITIFDSGSRGDTNPSVEKSEIDGDEDHLLYEAQNFVEQVISVNVYAANGAEVLHGIEALAALPPIRLSDDVTFRPVFVESSRVRNVPDFQDTHHAYRYQCDFTIRTSYLVSSTEYVVNRVRVEGEFAGMEAVSDTDEQEI